MSNIFPSSLLQSTMLLLLILGRCWWWCIFCRLDSLIILDVLLERCPCLVAGVAARLLPNLVSLIAQPRQLTSNTGSSQQRGHKSATTTSLIVNPNSRLSTQKWRVHVLRRLGAFFDAVVTHSSQSVDSSESASSSPVVVVTDTTTAHHCVKSSALITSSSLHHFHLRFLHCDIFVLFMGDDSFNFSQLYSIKHVTSLPLGVCRQSVGPVSH